MCELMKGQDPSHNLVKETHFPCMGSVSFGAGRYADFPCGFLLDSYFDGQVDDIREDDEAAAEALEAAKKQEKGGKAA